jgi:hypothetical protein
LQKEIKNEQLEELTARIIADELKISDNETLLDELKVRSKIAAHRGNI